MIQVLQSSAQLSLKNFITYWFQTSAVFVEDPTNHWFQRITIMLQMNSRAKRRCSGGLNRKSVSVRSSLFPYCLRCIDIFLERPCRILRGDFVRGMWGSGEWLTVPRIIQKCSSCFINILKWSTNGYSPQVRSRQRTFSTFSICRPKCIIWLLICIRFKMEMEEYPEYLQICFYFRLDMDILHMFLTKSSWKITKRHIIFH